MARRIDTYLANLIDEDTFAFYEAVRDFSDEHVAPHLLGWEREHQLVPDSCIQAMGEMGGQQRSLGLIKRLDQPPEQPRGIPETMHQHQGRRRAHAVGRDAPWRTRSTATQPSKPETGGAHLQSRSQTGSGP